MNSAKAPADQLSTNETSVEATSSATVPSFDNCMRALETLWPKRRAGTHKSATIEDYNEARKVAELAYKLQMEPLVMKEELEKLGFVGGDAYEAGRYWKNKIVKHLKDSGFTYVEKKKTK